MTNARFEQEIFIQTPPEKALGFMENVENHLKVHPLMVSIRLLETSTAPDGTPVQSYAIRDRMRLGPLIIRFTYHAALQVRPEGELIFDAFQFPRIKLHNIFRFQPEEAGTRVKEEVNIQAPRFLIKMVYEQAQQSHRRMWLNLKELLEEQGAGHENK